MTPEQINVAQPSTGSPGMQILNEKITADIESGKPLKLDLGSGGRSKKGCYSVDHLELSGVDIVADLNKPLSQLPDNCADYVYTRHALEHVSEFMQLMGEIHRITMPGGRVEIIVPHFSNPYYYSDPTHLRFFGLYTMYYFVDEDKQPNVRKVPAFYSDIRFELSEVRIDFYQSSRLDRIIMPAFSKLINKSLRWQDLYERRLCHWFPAWQLCYVMQPQK